jgi:hypothetical protein
MVGYLTNVRVVFECVRTRSERMLQATLSLASGVGGSKDTCLMRRRSWAAYNRSGTSSLQGGVDGRAWIACTRSRTV